jgi:hypothetical protein
MTDRRHSMAQRLSIIPEKGKYYVMEGFMTKNHPKPDEVKEMMEFNLGAPHMLIAGPFETKAEAEANRRAHPEAHRLEVWLCELGD